jgi:hypothetical protein
VSEETSYSRTRIDKAHLLNGCFSTKCLEPGISTEPLYPLQHAEENDSKEYTRETNEQSDN